jgi:hypothetical protein
MATIILFSLIVVSLVSNIVLWHSHFSMNDFIEKIGKNQNSFLPRADFIDYKYHLNNTILPRIDNLEYKTKVLFLKSEPTVLYDPVKGSKMDKTYSYTDEEGREFKITLEKKESVPLPHTYYFPKIDHYLFIMYCPAINLVTSNHINVASLEDFCETEVNQLKKQLAKCQKSTKKS